MGLDGLQNVRLNLLPTGTNYSDVISGVEDTGNKADHLVT